MISLKERVENFKEDCKSLVNRCELQIRTSALNNLGANPKEQVQSFIAELHFLTADLRSAKYLAGMISLKEKEWKIVKGL